MVVLSIFWISTALRIWWRILGLIQYLGFNSCMACRVKHMTCRFKSDGGNLVVRPCSLREVLRVTWSTEFSDKGSVREVSEPAGCSVSEPICSLVSDKVELSTLSYIGEDRSIYPDCPVWRGGETGDRAFMVTTPVLYSTVMRQLITDDHFTQLMKEQASLSAFARLLLWGIVMGKMTGRKLKAQNYFGQKRKNLIVCG